MSIKADVNPDEYTNANYPVCIELLQQLVVSMGGLKLIGAKRRYYFPNRIEAMPNPRLLERFCQ
jgi:hypothetical protein